MKYGVIGTGAVGGYYGSLLARNNVDVHFLLHNDYHHVKENGLIVESVNGDFSLPDVHAYLDPGDMPPCDVVIVSLKTTQNSQLSGILPQVVKENGIVAILQNGLGNEEDVSRIVPGAIVVGGLCFLCSNKIGPGLIRHLDYGAVRFGEYRADGNPAGLTPAVKMLADVFKSSGIETYLTEDLGRARWEKLVWNMPFNGLSVILNATTDQLLACESSCALVREIMMEVISGAQHCGFPVEDSFADKMIETTKDMTVYSPSMKLDFEAERRLEVDSLYWRPIKKAEAAGFNMTTSRVIACQLDFLNKDTIGGI